MLFIFQELTQEPHNCCIFFGAAPAPVFFKQLRLKESKNIWLRLPITVFKLQMKLQIIHLPLGLLTYLLTHCPHNALVSLLKLGTRAYFT